MKILIAGILVGAIALVAFKQRVAPVAEATGEISTAHKTQAPLPVLEKIRSDFPASPEMLVLVRGEVLSVNEIGVIIATKTPFADNPNWKVPPGAGAKEIERLAQGAQLAEIEQYGPLQEWKAERFQATSRTPRNEATGVLFLANPPEGMTDTKKVRVVAVPTKEVYEYITVDGAQAKLPVYSAKYRMQ